MGDLVPDLARQGFGLGPGVLPDDDQEHGDLATELVGHADRGCLDDRGVGDGNGFELRRPDALAGDLERVVRPPSQVPESVGVARRPVAVHPGPRQPAPVRVQVALAVRRRPAPEAARHPRPGCPDRQLADLVDDGAATGIDDLRRHADARSVERCRTNRAEGRCTDDPARDLGPAAVVDDRQPSLANGLE